MTSLSPDSSTTRKSILVIDDEKNIRRALDLVLSGEGYGVLLAASAEQGAKLLAQPDAPVDLVVLDLKLPGMSGLELLEKLRAEEAHADLPIVVISGHATVHDAVKALKLGATDFFEKPLARERVLVSVRNALAAARARAVLREASRRESERYEMVGRSPAMLRLFSEIERVAPTRASVLITGESGTGKELISRAIHRLSPRTDGPFIRVNCAAIPRELIESELFGHEKGAFTGAQARKRGFFEQAHGGTLFLDEIGDMDLVAQAKVLRALQSGEVSRVGSEHVMHVDVRVLAATNKDLERAVADGSFREDLFFRLNVIPIRSPALREREGDIDLLVRSFMGAFARENGCREKPIEDAVIEALAERRWPGNVRELRNVVERMAILSGARVTMADLPEDPHEDPFDDDGDARTAPSDAPEANGVGRTSVLPPPLPDPGGSVSLKAYREHAEREYIVLTLRRTGWNVSKTAAILGVERTNLHKKIRAYAIKRDADGAATDD